MSAALSSPEPLASHVDRICVFDSGKRSAKLVTPEGVISAEKATFHHAQEIEIAGLDGLLARLQRLLVAPRYYVVRGALVNGPAFQKGVRRLLYAREDSAATVKDCARWWVALDVDSIPLPEKTDIQDLGKCAREVIKLLPAEFHGVRVILQASASHGIKPGARLRLWFWLSRPILTREVGIWLAGAPVDQAIFTPSAAIYTAAPVFERRQDHLATRLILVDGKPAVEVPPIVVPPRPPRESFAGASACLEDIEAALAIIPNEDVAWEAWLNVAMATYAASSGSDEGFEAFCRWSAKSTKHDREKCIEKWEELEWCPPTNKTFGTLVFLARKEKPEWQVPSQGDRLEMAQNEFAATGGPEPVATPAVTPEPPIVDVAIVQPTSGVARKISQLLGEVGAVYEFTGRLSVIDVPKGKESMPKIRALNPDDVPHVVDRYCRLLEVNKSGDTVVTTLPKDLRSSILSPETWRSGVPLLNGFAAGPILTQEGVIYAGQGYDPTTKLYGLPVPTLAVPEHPTSGQAEAALIVLRQVFRTFAFEDALMIDDAEAGVPVVDLRTNLGAAESAALCGLLTAICRPSLNLSPGLLVSAPSNSGSGVGKGLLVRTISAIAFGCSPRAFTAGKTREELDKRLGAALMGAYPILLLDNVNSTALQSDTLASVLTESPARVRRLGSSEMVELSTNTFVAVTGNGLTPSEDLVRRFLVCELDAKVENPSARPFHDGDEVFLEGLSGRRADLLSAALTIWRWGVQSSDLKRGLPLGSFSRWARWCRDPLLALGCQDPVARIADTRARDPYRARIAEAFGFWWSEHGDATMRATEVSEAVRAALDPHGRTRQSFAAVLSRFRGSRVGGFVMETYEGSKAAKTGTTYRLKWAGEGDPPARRPAATEAYRLAANEFTALVVLEGGKAVSSG